MHMRAYPVLTIMAKSANVRRERKRPISNADIAGDGTLLSSHVGAKMFLLHLSATHIRRQAGAALDAAAATAWGSAVEHVHKWYAVYCKICLLYTSPSPRDLSTSRMPSSA